MSKERNMERNGSYMLNVNLTIWSDTHVAHERVIFLSRQRCKMKAKKKLIFTILLKFYYYYYYYYDDDDDHHHHHHHHHHYYYCYLQSNFIEIAGPQECFSGIIPHIFRTFFSTDYFRQTPTNTF